MNLGSRYIIHIKYYKTVICINIEKIGGWETIIVGSTDFILFILFIDI